MEGLQVLKQLAFPLYGICLDDTGVIIYKCEEVLLTSKTDRHYLTHEVSINILIRFYCSLLGYPIIPLRGFYLFIAITDISFRIIIEDNVVINEIFLP